MEGLIAGRIVHFNSSTDETHLAAIVVDVLEPVSGLVNLFAFDKSGAHPGAAQRVPYDADGGRWTWHWIERA